MATNVFVHEIRVNIDGEVDSPIQIPVLVHVSATLQDSKGSEEGVPASAGVHGTISSDNKVEILLIAMRSASALQDDWNANGYSVGMDDILGPFSIEPITIDESVLQALTAKYGS